MKEQKYCCFCGRELVFKILYDGSKEKYCDNCDHVFFQTPSPCVVVIVINENRVLLTRAVGLKHPHWAFIAGHISLGETAEEAAIREVYEEVGLKASSLAFLETYISKAQDVLFIVFKAETKNTSIRKSQELEDAKWFDLSCPLPLHPESTVAHIFKQVFPKITFENLKELENKKANKNLVRNTSESKHS